MALLVAAKAGAVWFFWHKRKALIQQQKDEAAATGQVHATALQAQKDAAAAQVAAAQQKLDAAAAAHQQLEAQHNDHLQAAHRREQENARRIAGLAADLAATREVAAQLQPAQIRIKDLETALASERGRVGALEKAVEVSSKRATDFETRLVQAHLSVTELRQSSAQREGELQADIARFTDNERIFSTLQTITYHLNQKEIPNKLSIYSQGKKEDFGNLSSLATLYLNGNVFEDFHHLVKADVLFMAKSSFSYSAALLSDGLIVYEPFWHPPLNEWLLFEDNERFINLLSEKIQTLHTKNINA